MYVHLLGKGTYKKKMSKQFKDESFIDEDGYIIYSFQGSPSDIRKVARVFEKYYGKRDADPHWTYQVMQHNFLMEYPIDIATCDGRNFYDIF